VGEHRVGIDKISELKSDIYTESIHLSANEMPDKKETSRKSKTELAALFYGQKLMPRHNYSVLRGN
jgi:hypothetical protein